MWAHARTCVGASHESQPGQKVAFLNVRGMQVLALMRSPSRIWTRGCAAWREGFGSRCCRQESSDRVVAHTHKPACPGLQPATGMFQEVWADLVLRNEGGRQALLLQGWERVQVVLNRVANGWKVGVELGHDVQVEGNPDVGVPISKQIHGSEGSKSKIDSFSPKRPTRYIMHKCHMNDRCPSTAARRLVCKGWCVFQNNQQKRSRRSTLLFITHVLTT